MLQPSAAESYLRDADMTSAPVYLSSVVEQVAQWQEYLWWSKWHSGRNICSGASGTVAGISVVEQVAQWQEYL